MGALLDGKVYVMGGFTPGVTGLIDTMDIFDLTKKTWTTGPSLPIEVAQSGAVAVCGRIFVVGGDFTDGLSGHVLVFDPSTATWTMSP